MRGPGCCACAMGKGDRVHLKRQSPEQKIVEARDGVCEDVGVTIHPCAVCHD